MFFCFTFGQYNHSSPLRGFEHVTCRCQNCGNNSGRVVKARPFITLCWVPVVPFTIRGFQEIHCNVCNFDQPLTQRPDVQAMRSGGAAPAPLPPGPAPQSQPQPQPQPQPQQPATAAPWRWG